DTQLESAGALRLRLHRARDGDDEPLDLPRPGLLGDVVQLDPVRPVPVVQLRPARQERPPARPAPLPPAPFRRPRPLRWVVMGGRWLHTSGTPFAPSIHSRRHERQCRSNRLFFPQNEPETTREKAADAPRARYGIVLYFRRRFL